MTPLRFERTPSINPGAHKLPPLRMGSLLLLIAGATLLSGLGCPPAEPATNVIYSHDTTGQLYTVNVDTRVATLIGDSNLTALDSTGMITQFGSAGDLTLAADGRLLLSTNEAELLAIDRDTFEMEDLGELPSPDMWALERLPDGRLIGITSTNLVYEIDETTAESELQGALETEFNIRETGGGSFPI